MKIHLVVDLYITAIPAYSEIIGNISNIVLYQSEPLGWEGVKVRPVGQVGHVLGAVAGQSLVTIRSVVRLPW